MILLVGAGGRIGHGVAARLLLLDQPTAGMSPRETERMRALIAALPTDLTVLLIEHDMDVVFSMPTASRC